MSAYIFGPVPSRRLGRSVGIDLVPVKTCTYDCVYCQLGATTERTVTRKAWVPTEAVAEEIGREAGRLDRADVVTFAGSGEPTLHSALGELIRCAKRASTRPVAVLTNGSLLWREDVREDLREADLVIPSLDAPDEVLFRNVNRPHPELRLDRIVEGMVRFREAYAGQIWLEILLLAGFTGIEEEVRKLAAHVEAIRPDRVQLCTVTRPPSAEYALPVPMARLERFASFFPCRVDVVSASSTIPAGPPAEAYQSRVLELLERRPCTAEDVSRGLGMDPEVVIDFLQDLLSRGSVTVDLCEGQRYFRAQPH